MCCAYILTLIVLKKCTIKIVPYNLCISFELYSSNDILFRQAHEHLCLEYNTNTLKTV